MQRAGFSTHSLVGLEYQRVLNLMDFTKGHQELGNSSDWAKSRRWEGFSNEADFGKSERGKWDRPSSRLNGIDCIESGNEVLFSLSGQTLQRFSLRSNSLELIISGPEDFCRLAVFADRYPVR
jgi:hypothetical protein